MRHSTLSSENLTNNKIDVLHVRLTEMHAAHQNLPPAIRTLRLNSKGNHTPKNGRNLTIDRRVISDMTSSIEVICLLHIFIV